MSGAAPLRVAVIAGEESGDLLGADLLRGLAAFSGRTVEPLGVGGAHLRSLGLTSLFDPGEIALVGISAVVMRLPSLVRRIETTARAITAAAPDCLVTIDSPDFTLRVAKKVRAANPSIPIVHYVCPSVWAWRPERARKMAAFVDHVLCILPFEVEALKTLEGPPATYVGHRLTHDPDLAAAAERQRARPPRMPGETPTVLVLPGSRRSEVKGLLGPFREAVDILAERGPAPRLLLPTVEHVEELVRQETSAWRNRPEIILDRGAKYRAFGEADAAMAASGTVSLELALARVPTVVSYKLDPIFRWLVPMIRVWSACLPNLIADRPVMPEFYDGFVRPGMLARLVEGFIGDTPARAAQLDGFDRVAAAMATDRPAGTIGAEAVLRVLGASGR